MSKAIGIRFVPYDKKKHLTNHFFGKPVCPKGMEGEFDDQVLFLGMIHLPEIVPFDKENRLPHTGYLYFFLDVSNPRRMDPIVRYVETEPEVIIDDYNHLLALEGFSGIETPRGIAFEEVEADAEGCKLLGVPCDWNYPDPPKSDLLLTLDHISEELNFQVQLNGFTYIFFGPKGEEFSGVYGYGEYD